MKPRSFALVVACAAVAVALFQSPVTMAQGTPAPSQPTVAGAKVEAAEVQITGEVTAIDVDKRMISIKGPRGRTGVFAVDPAVRNLGQVKVGDRVVVDYKAAVALALRKGGDGIREKVEAEAASAAPAGALPGAAAMQRTTIVANVEKIDTKKKLATLRGPQGRFVDVKIEDPNVLKTIKAGDQVVAVFYESAAVNVRPAPAPKPAAKPAAKPASN